LAFYLELDVGARRPPIFAGTAVHIPPEVTADAIGPLETEIAAEIGRGKPADL
jgi:hypothetical protein